MRYVVTGRVRSIESEGDVGDRENVAGNSGDMPAGSEEPRVELRTIKIPVTRMYIFLV